MTQRMEQKLFTIAELARCLDLPESTTRYYCNRFAEHLSSVGEGRRRRFNPESLNVLRTITETMRRDKNAYAVDLALRSDNASAPIPVAPVPAVQEQTLTTSATFANQLLSLMENQTKALQEIAGAMATFAERVSVAPPATAPAETAPLGQGPADNRNAAALREEIAALREQIRSSESVHQNDFEQLRKWLIRLGETIAGK